MALNPLKAFVFVVGGTFAAAATALYSGAMRSDGGFAPEAASNGEAVGESAAARTAPEAPGQPTASGESATQEAKAQLPETPLASAQAPETNPDDAQQSAATPAADPEAGAIPTFDVVRVEPDGGMVVAGRAAPGATVKLVESGNMLGSAVADSEGEFAIVLDEPLPPGEHQIQLAGTMPDGSTETSTQTALVSVPADRKGQVLAMVEEPGAPSRVLTVPEAPSAASAPDAPAADSAAEAQDPADPGEAEENSVSAQPPAAAGQTADAADGPSVPEADGETETAASESGPEQAAVEEAAQAPRAASEAAPPAASADPARTAVAEVEREDGAAGNPGQPPGERRVTGQAPVSVQAVEIEGSKVYVAGLAAPNTTVRVYADDILLGDARTSSAGQFLVEASRDLPVGNYTVRADVLNADGVVIARAAVPFEREVGEAVAAVAPELQTAAEAAARSSGSIDLQTAPPPELAPARDDGGTSDPGATAVANAGGGNAGDLPLERPDAVAGGSETASASSVEAAEKSARAAAGSDGHAVSNEQAATSPSRGAAPAEATVSARSGENGETTAALETEPGRSTASQGQVAPQPYAADAETQGSRAAVVQGESANAAQALDSAYPVGQGQASGPSGAAAGEPATEIAPKLQNVDAAVIIRRGDSLWRISRRVYGYGTRYSTIYLANSDQIRNPDLILPGQVFAVPARSQQGESADYGAIRAQVTTKPETPVSETASD